MVFSMNLTTVLIYQTVDKLMLMETRKVVEFLWEKLEGIVNAVLNIWITLVVKVVRVDHEAVCVRRDLCHAARRKDKTIIPRWKGTFWLVPLEDRILLLGPLKWTTPKLCWQIKVSKRSKEDCIVSNWPFSFQLATILATSLQKWYGYPFFMKNRGLLCL